MGQAVCRRAATVKFWDGYARWYRLWMEHTHYHERIIEALLAMTEPGWRVLDIGAGNGVLSIPLCVRGCDVTALEPSVGMRNLLYEEMFRSRIDRLTVDERPWEEVPSYECFDYDLILACNTLHLTETGFEEAMAKIFRACPENVFLISEIRPPDVRMKWHYGNHTMVFAKAWEMESSYAYHHLDEMVDHWAFKKGRSLHPEEIRALKERTVLQGGHLWIRDTARVSMYWWRRDGRR